MSETIVVLDAIGEERAQSMRALLPPGFALAHARENSVEHLLQIIAQADYAISGQVAVDAATLAAAKRLKLLHKWGVGVDNFDIEAARRLRIKVARTTGSNAVPVAEFTIGLMIAALRHIAWGHEGLQQGQWRTWELPAPFLLSNKTVGLLGFGAIGKAVARLLSGFSCEIIYNKPHPMTAQQDAEFGVRYASLPDLLACADVVSLHCPLTPATANVIDRAAFRAMKPGAVLINVARGGIVNEDDLLWALRNAEIHAAAMDVYATEPLPADSPLRGLANLTLTPHRAAMATDTFEPTIRRMFANIERVSRGQALPPADVVVE